MNQQPGADWILRVTDLKQYTYCPRIVFYAYCLPAIRPITYKMQVGQAKHDTAEELERRRSLRAYGLTQGQRFFNVTLTSSRLGLSGRVDMVIRTPGETIPVEYKYSPGRTGRHWMLQLAAYGMMLEESGWGAVKRGFLYFIPARRARQIELDPDMRCEVEGMIEQIRQMIAREAMPPPTSQRARCVVCEFRRFCNDV
jgi:CRISPR-associated exonuclease Cas4